MSDQTHNNRNGRTKWLLLFLFLLLGSGLAYWIGVDPGERTHDTDTEITDGTTEQNALPAGVSPLLTNVSPTGETVVISKPGKAQTLTLASGTTLEVPANAFVQADGSPVTSEVQIRVKEYHDAADIIASGIPMSVTHADGSKQWMQTAGMFDLRAQSNGQSVDLAEGQTINVGLISEVGGDYDFWQYDEGEGNWDNMGPGAPAVPVSLSTSNQSMNQVEQEIAQLRQATVQAPDSPEQEKGNILGFQDLDVSHIPALKGQNPVLLVYAGNKAAEAPKNNSWIHQAKWFKKKIHATKTPGVYELTLLGDSLYKIPVRRALSGVELEKAKAKYEQLLAEYKANLALIAQKETMLAEQRAFRRNMSVAAMGLYNYDILLKQPNAIPLMADFDFEGLPNAVRENITVYLIMGEGRAVAALPFYDWKKVRIDLGNRNRMLAVLPNNKVALFPERNFEEQADDIRAAKGKDYLFDMELQAQEVKSVNDLRALIQQASS